MKKCLVLLVIVTVMISMVACTTTPPVSQEPVETEMEQPVEGSEEIEDTGKIEIPPFNESDYTPMDYESLNRNPDENEGKLVMFTGTVLQDSLTNDDGSISSLIFIDEYTDQLVETTWFPETFGRLLADDVVTVYGISVGIFEYTSAEGSINSVPWILVYKIVLQE
ncbi:MAG: hypothetical protein LBN34_09710 [Clostridiales Family XIII bacterium]|jgi:hypothetical protein|nr:hypothetical protein [Clostridiales Family XIII bacterium]